MLAAVTIAVALGANRAAGEQAKTSPTIEMVFGGECGTRNDGQITAGYKVTIAGKGFTAKDNTVRIGPVELSAPGLEHGEFVEVLLPGSVPPGKYEISVENALGKSDGFPVVLVAPPPPQNVTPGKPVPVHPTTNPRLAEAGWPMFGHDAKHTGLSPYGAVANLGTLRWKFTTGSAIFSSPAIGADGTVYVGSGDDNLYAINPNDTQKWKFKTCDAISSTPAITADGTIYVGSGDGNLYAINSVDGTQRWKFSTGNGYYPFESAAPAVGANGTIYIVCNNDLCAIDPNGSQKWRFAAGGGASGSPAIDKSGTIYVGGEDCNNKSGVCSGNLFAVNPTGTQKWKFTTGGAVNSAPVIGPDGTIFVVDTKRDESQGFLPSDLYAVNPDGTLKWKFSAGTRSTFMPIPVVGPDGAIYAASGDCNLYALDPKGAQKWSFRMCTYGYSGGEQVPSPVLDAAGTIYIGSIDYGPKYTLLAIGRDGNLLWNYLIGESHESVPDLTSAAIGADGTVYVGSRDYSLYAIGTPLSAPAPAPTPVAAKIVISPEKIDFGMATTSAQHIGMVRVTASESNKVPVLLEQFSVNGKYYSLWKSDCEPGQPLDPGKFCMIDFFFLPMVTTGETDLGEIVVTTNAEVVVPPGGRVPLTGGGKVWRPGP